ncbi:glucosamine--fructose-6-phosphate aminotransferase (isomerizing) [Clostridium saccharoperbutylacetonicum]|uniref:Glutamine--fructose-6-phosphate aminotransferase [isomerizing] n=1 Tax=Clostridium saccharoperbutylacetonicum N1-4(HMT) TaxID=931276 RepID=M1MDB9_9CLOT|nr:glutamine--fructose-6-phosphate transaminase (isomerizing) [Clostridium saccharoperbutylacetonicum]AGF55919.1 glutamine--fructose-6-phosphate aminotransferase [Clostridium saccharoperbutylacetonicum N1-4(HMT)]NRT63342.1 glucosamine--fructose-6-phosphate aminotransferase (isomerizing) [Clostridium saccharoperbutylacetonicum]NSB26704.1 glucosamine--fructose-6-phosphate aminotransferase (isomerizing) [Clostridium saccharoperbutylacetonicum]NSB46055.1 glucosamine--fructose-6-phosphate aminotrans
MCGIVGYFGDKTAKNFLVDGLSKLEYRGYDSAGIAVVNEGKVNIVKHKGRLANLTENLDGNKAEGTVGIGHTRWATHGEPSDINSHPHQSSKGDITVVHNGIIENYLELRQWLKGQGYEFISQTDTEVIPNLIHYYYKGDLFQAVVKATERLEGSYALGVISGQEPDKLVAVRKDSPLIVGLGQGETFIASDIPAIISYTRDIYLLEDREFVVITKDGAKILSGDGTEIKKDVFKVTWNEDAAEKGGYDSFMLKEINEQPKAIKDTLASRLSMNNDINFEDFKLSKEDLDKIDRIFIVACGTAYNAGLMGSVAIEKLAKIPVVVDIASEFRYKDPLVTNKSLVITLSQSGETADTLAVLRDCKKVGARTLAITNVVGSSISREADNVIYTMAGPEIAVASTKAYTTQVVVMYLMAMYFSELRGLMTKELDKELREALLLVPEKVQIILDKANEIEETANLLANEKDVFYLGRGADYALCIEASLKLKEISYIHSEAYAGGELKHGTIALIEKGTKVIALLTQRSLREKMISNIVEVKARGAEVIGIAYENDVLDESIFDKVIRIPELYNLVSPIVAIIALQLLAYYTAKNKGCDIDKPRNLAKSVTVE